MSELTDMTDVSGQPETTQTVQTTDQRASDARECTRPALDAARQRASRDRPGRDRGLGAAGDRRAGTGGGASDSVRTMAIAVAGAYGVLRAQERRGAEGAGE